MVDTEYLVDDYYITAVSIDRVSLTDHRWFHQCWNSASHSRLSRLP